MNCSATCPEIVSCFWQLAQKLGYMAHARTFGTKVYISRGECHLVPFLPTFSWQKCKKVQPPNPQLRFCSKKPWKKMKPKIGPSSLDICHHNCYALLHIILEVFYHHTIFRQRRTLNTGGILIWFLCFSKNVNLLEYGHRIIIPLQKSSSFSLQGEQLCLIDLLLQSQLEVEAAALKMNLSQKCKCCSDGRVVSWLSRRSLLQRHASEGGRIVENE